MANGECYRPRTNELAVMAMNRTDDECYDPGKVSPVDRPMPREDDFGGIMYWADEDREIDMSEELRAALREWAKKETAQRAQLLRQAANALTRPTPIPVGETSEVEQLLKQRKQLADDIAYYSGNEASGHATLAALDAKIVAALSIRETQAPPAQGVDMRQQGQDDGFAAAVQWLRDRSAMKPPATLWHAAEILADQLEQSRIPAAAPSPATGQGGEA